MQNAKKTRLCSQLCWCSAFFSAAEIARLKFHKCCCLNQIVVRLLMYMQGPATLCALDEIGIFQSERFKPRQLSFR